MTLLSQQTDSYQAWLAPCISTTRSIHPTCTRISYHLTSGHHSLYGDYPEASESNSGPQPPFFFVRFMTSQSIRGGLEGRSLQILMNCGRCDRRNGSKSASDVSATRLLHSHSTLHAGVLRLVEPMGRLFSLIIQLFCLIIGQNQAPWKSCYPTRSAMDLE